MKPAAFTYHAPVELDEAMTLLAELGSDGKVLAGGQSLIPLLNMRLAAPAALVDITRVAGLDRIEVDIDAVRVGATVTHETLLRDEAVAEAIPLVTEALRWVAHPVIRNRGTTVGSIAHADPAAEMPAVLALLGGHVELMSSDGRREVPASEFLLGPLESDVRPGEVATAIVLPRPMPRTGATFAELARRHGDYAIVGVGVTVTVDAAGAVIAARAAFTGVDPVPTPIDLSAALRGQHVDELDATDAVDHARASIDPEGDIHASAAYRGHLAGVLLARALEVAAQRAAEGGR